jgi:hypothetical protein
VRADLSDTGRRIPAEPVRARRARLTKQVDQDEHADEHDYHRQHEIAEDDEYHRHQHHAAKYHQQPPAAPVDIVKPADCHREAGQEYDKCRNAFKRAVAMMEDG